jgi:hypothetical protein
MRLPAGDDRARELLVDPVARKAATVTGNGLDGRQGIALLRGEETTRLTLHGLLSQPLARSEFLRGR